MVAAQLIESIPLFAGVDRAELDGFLRIFQHVAFGAGTCLARQGQPADSAFILESGRAEVVTALPGGGELSVAMLGPGAVLGEMALLESGLRSATVLARGPVDGYFIDRDGFRMLLAQRNRAAFTIQNRITLTLCRRLRELNARIVEHAAGGPRTLAERASAAQRGKCSFDHRAFLPALPLFRKFGPDEIGEFAAMTEAMELERGQALFGQGDASGACYAVVRGAVEITGARNGSRHRIGILGPGRLCGVLALIEGQPHSMSASVRERATLLEIGKAAFDRLFTGDSRVAARFQDAINQELLQALARTNNHLTRLISQARIRGGRQEQKKAEELLCALGAQDYRAAQGQ